MAKIVVNEEELMPVAQEPIRIDKNIPMPPRSRRGRPSKYQWAAMEVGDSFLFPKELALSTCRTLAWDAGRKLNRRFTVMETSSGYRCWRVETNKEESHEANG